MNKLSILLLIYILSVVNVNAASVAAPDDVSFAPAGTTNTVNLMPEIISEENKLVSLYEFFQASKSDTVPPTLWIVGLGLCLVFLGYKMKNKAE